MPLRCPTGAARVAPSLLAPAYTLSAPSLRIPLRICPSCRTWLSPRGLSTWPGVRRRPTPIRYQLLSDNLLSHSPALRHGGLLPSLWTAPYATDSMNSLPTRSKKSTLPPRRLVILGMPTPRRSVRLEEQGPVDKEDVDNLTQSLQTFHFQVAEEQVTDEILLFKPENLRVSKSRFGQLYRELNTAFLVTQIKDYLATTQIDFAGGIKRLRKGDAINLVLREIWRVEVAEEIAAEMDVIRQKELRFRRMDLFFMMAEGGEMLQRLASGNRARIILNSQNNTVMIRGTQRAIEEIEHTLNTLPDQTIDKRVDLSPLMRVGRINENYLAAISRLTTVFLETDANNITLYSTRNYDSSNIGDAQRLVFNSIDLHLRQTYTLLGETRSSEPLTGALYPVSEEQTLPWLYRGKIWSRWRGVRSPRDRREDVPMEESAVGDEGLLLSVSPAMQNAARGSNVDYSDLRGFLDTLPTKEIGAGSPLPAESIPEAAEVSTAYHAIVGQVLHSSPNLPMDCKARSLSEVLSSSPSHVLCNSVPRLIDFLSTLNPVTYRYDFKIILKFSPSPWRHPKNFELLPPVELELHINPEINEVLSLKIAAVESHNITDVLMPRNSCDLRFVRRRLVRLESKTHAVETYLKSADLDVLGEERLRVGEELALDVPKWMVKGTEREETWSLDDDGKIVDRMVPVEDLSPAPLDLDAANSETSGVDPGMSAEAASESEVAAIFEAVDTEADAEATADSKAAVKAGADNKTEAGDTVPITYYFAGMETRSSTIFDFEGAPLVYTKVEAGTSGGSYDEVLLECTKDSIEYLTPLEEQKLGREEEIADTEWDERLQEWKVAEEAELQKMLREQREAALAKARGLAGAPAQGEEATAAEEATPKTNSDPKQEGYSGGPVGAGMEFLLGEEEGAQSATPDKSSVPTTTEAASASEASGDVATGSDPAPSELPEPTALPVGEEVEVASETEAEGTVEEKPSFKGIEDLDARIEAALDALESTGPGKIQKPAPEPEEEDDGNPNKISNTVFQRFVKTARRLVEAVEKTHTDGKKRPL
ncbi:hypothetical protein DRE_07583 [Drechslerella stenobrocha 248]|uniref:Uncharacterized protein n=1 Tax=Drechslerella stenobrocha 248 TaxID=1043628 RepID=W7HSJ0_9PEZI|nr:hypothetical protein DRE_07583 [Drechslerella stenobrocha 248]